MNKIDYDIHLFISIVKGTDMHITFIVIRKQIGPKTENSGHGLYCLGIGQCIVQVQIRMTVRL